MDKSIGFDIDHKNTPACPAPAGQPERYRKLRTEVGRFREWPQTQRGPGVRLHLTIEASGRSGFLCDGLVDVVERLEVSNPPELKWIYRYARDTPLVSSAVAG